MHAVAEVGDLVLEAATEPRVYPPPRPSERTLVLLEVLFVERPGHAQSCHWGSTPRKAE